MVSLASFSFENVGWATKNLSLELWKSPSTFIICLIRSAVLTKSHQPNLFRIIILACSNKMQAPEKCYRHLLVVFHCVDRRYNLFVTLPGLPRGTGLVKSIFINEMQPGPSYVLKSDNSRGNLSYPHSIHKIVWTDKHLFVRSSYRSNFNSKGWFLFCSVSNGWQLSRIFDYFR